MVTVVTPENNELKSFFGKFAGSVLLSGMTALGAYSFYWGVTQADLSSASRTWPSTQGRVISSYVDVSKGSKGTSYWPVVEYQYKVGRLTMENNKIQFGQNGSARQADALATVEKYREGRAVAVYYNPRAPAISCLEPGKYQSVSHLSIFFGILWFLFGFVALVGPLFWHTMIFLGERDARKRRQRRNTGVM